MPTSDKITLITIDGVNPDDALKALLHCMKDISFRNVKLITFNEPKGFKNFSNDIELIIIDKLDYIGYNWFKLHELDNYIATDFCLTIEPDGLIKNPALWNDEFLLYDYIGAPWPSDEISNWPYLDYNNRVGNGGFSLRSKKLLSICRNIPYSNKLYVGEDVLICRKHRDLFLKEGIKFAPVNVAIKFSVEFNISEFNPNQQSFGFHRYYDYEYMLKQIIV